MYPEKTLRAHSVAKAPKNACVAYLTSSRLPAFCVLHKNNIIPICSAQSLRRGHIRAQPVHHVQTYLNFCQRIFRPVLSMHAALCRVNMFPGWREKKERVKRSGIVMLTFSVSTTLLYCEFWVKWHSVCARATIYLSTRHVDGQQLRWTHQQKFIYHRCHHHQRREAITIVFQML